MNGPEPERSTHTIEPGEHLWSIASRTMRSRLGREPNEQETARYWVRLVRLNRDRLPDPDNPDLVYTGGTVLLPD